MKKIGLCMVMAMFLTACAGGVSQRPDLKKTNAVENAINAQIAKESFAVESAAPAAGDSNLVEESVAEENGATSTTLDPISEAMESIQSSRIAEQNKSQEEQERLMKSTEGVDYDLTKMNSDMVYAMVYQLMTEPEQYEGKVFRIKGMYYASFFETTNQYYHYCIIQDALACCTQGIEFIWDDGSHVYPEEYPDESDMVEVTGTFETYSENNDGRLYCRLNHASLVVKTGNAGE